MVGGDYLPRNLACLADDGRHVSIATQRGVTAETQHPRRHAPPVDPDRFDAPPAPDRLQGLVAEELRREIWPFVESGQLRPVMDRTFPLADAAAAHARMEAGEHVGKIVLLQARPDRPGRRY